MIQNEGNLNDAGFSLARLKDRGLSKWPLMVVTGKPVTEDQALEVIRRTDAFFGWTPLGNNRKFIAEVQALTKVPDVMQMARSMELADALRIKDAWNKHWGLVETAFVKNDWISSSYIFGANGWMHPDGKIGIADHIGKWPSVEEVYDDWVEIAKAFPFLEIEATIIDDGDDGDADELVASYLIGNGTVELVDPLLRNIHAERGRDRDEWRNKLSIDLVVKNQDELIWERMESGVENAIPMSVIEGWAAKFCKP